MNALRSIATSCGVDIESLKASVLSLAFANGWSRRVLNLFHRSGRELQARIVFHLVMSLDDPRDASSREQAIALILDRMAGR